MTHWLKLTSLYWLKVIGLNLFCGWLIFVTFFYVPTVVGKVIAFLMINFFLFHIWIKWHHQRHALLEGSQV